MSGIISTKITRVIVEPINPIRRFEMTIKQTIERKRDLVKVSRELAKAYDGYSEMSKPKKGLLVALTYKTLNRLDQ